ncbi:hypothetical protein V8C37DRAFT_393876 [Trichoderma ceciliae]
MACRSHGQNPKLRFFLLKPYQVQPSNLPLVLLFFSSAFLHVQCMQRHAADPMQSCILCFVSALAQYRSKVGLFGGCFLGACVILGGHRFAQCSSAQ